jgi:hypothetical protein
MNQIFKFSADYYKTFESPKYYCHPKHLSFASAIFFGLGFVVYFLYLSYNVITDAQYRLHVMEFSYRYVILFGLECCFLLAMQKLDKQREKAVLNKANAVNREIADSISEAKKSRLCKYFNTNDTEFLKYAKKIDEMLRLYESYKKPTAITPGFILQFIYNREARPRILALLILSFSLTLILIVNTGVNAETVYNVFNTANEGVLFFLYVSALFIIITVGFFVKVLSFFFGETVNWFLVLKSAESYHSTWAVRYLIRDLVEFQVFDKTDKGGVIIFP